MAGHAFHFFFVFMGEWKGNGAWTCRDEWHRSMDESWILLLGSWVEILGVKAICANNVCCLFFCYILHGVLFDDDVARLAYWETCCIARDVNDRDVEYGVVSLNSYQVVSQPFVKFAALVENTFAPRLAKVQSRLKQRGREWRRKAHCELSFISKFVTCSVTNYMIHHNYNNKEKDEKRRGKWVAGGYPSFRPTWLMTCPPN